MSSTATSTTDQQPDKQVVLSHLVHRLLQREGGNIPLERVTLRVSDFADIAKAHGWTVSVTEGTDGGARFEFERLR